jgi:transcriptional regulator with XRE-family HTH domain
MGRELRVARLLAGKTQLQVGRAAGTSNAQVSRIEHARVSNVSFRQLVRIGGAIGLRIWMRAYPGGRRLMDAPQIALLGRLTAASRGWKWQTEVTMPKQGDLRAADAVASNGICTVMVEAITKLVDFQAQSRSGLAKKRDLGADRVILLIADTRANRLALREAGDIAAGSFPLGTAEVLPAMEAGEDPGGDGIVLL